MNIIFDVNILEANLDNIPYKYLDFIISMNSGNIFVTAFKTINDMNHIDFAIFNQLAMVWNGLSVEERQPFEDFAQKM